VGYVPQGREIIPQLTVRENLLLGLEALPGGLARNRHIDPLVFELFPILEKFLARRGGDLSGGQQQQQVLAHGELGDDLAPLGHIAHTPTSPGMGRPTRQLKTLQLQITAALLQQTDHGFQQGGLTHAIAADQADHLAGSDVEVDIPKNMALAVIDIETSNIEQGHAASS
jgi:hypothetical protein